MRRADRSDSDLDLVQAFRMVDRETLALARTMSAVTLQLGSRGASHSNSRMSSLIHNMLCRRILPGSTILPLQRRSISPIGVVQISQSGSRPSASNARAQARGQPGGQACGVTTDPPTPPAPLKLMSTRKVKCTSFVEREGKEASAQSQLAFREH